MLRIATVHLPRAFAQQRENHSRIFFRLWHEPCHSVHALLAAEQPSTAGNRGPSYWFLQRGCLAPDHIAANMCLAPVAVGPFHHFYD